MDAAGLVNALVALGPTLKVGVVFNASTDPNNLLGRPNGYESKASFVDSRIMDPSDTEPGAVDLGGSVEYFSNGNAARARATYIQTVTKGLPASTEYDYVAGPALLRLPSGLTPDQASEEASAMTSAMHTTASLVTVS